MKNILVTGGAGFIGSNLVEFLSKNEKNRITVLDNLSSGRRDYIKSFPVHFVEGDVNDIARLLGDARFDAVYHLASLADVLPSYSMVTDYFSASAAGTLQVLEFVRRTGGVLVYAGSSSCYGDQPFQTSEEDDLEVTTMLAPYAVFKYLGEELVRFYKSKFQIPAVSLRFYNVYGPRVKTLGEYSIAIGIFLAQHFQGKPLTVIGDGKQTRDYVEVSDVVRIMTDFAERLEGGGTSDLSSVYNVGTGVTTAIIDIARMIDEDVVFIPKRENEARCTHAYISRLKWFYDSIGKPLHFLSVSDGIKNLMTNHADFFKKVALEAKR